METLLIIAIGMLFGIFMILSAIFIRLGNLGWVDRKLLNIDKSLKSISNTVESEYQDNLHIKKLMPLQEQLNRAIAKHKEV